MSTTLPRFRWSPEITRPTPFEVEAFHGESFVLHAEPKNYGAPLLLALQPGTTAKLYYQTPDMTESEWYGAEAVIDEASGAVEATWSPELDPGADALRFFLAVIAPDGAVVLRVFGNLRLAPSPGFNPATIQPEDIRDKIKTDLETYVDKALTAEVQARSEADKAVLERAKEYTDEHAGGTSYPLEGTFKTLTGTDGEANITTEGSVQAGSITATGTLKGTCANFSGVVFAHDVQVKDSCGIFFGVSERVSEVSERVSEVSERVSYNVNCHGHVTITGSALGAVLTCAKAYADAHSGGGGGTTYCASDGTGVVMGVKFGANNIGLCGCTGILGDVVFGTCNVFSGAEAPTFDSSGGGVVFGYANKTGRPYLTGLVMMGRENHTCASHAIVMGNCNILGVNTCSIPTISIGESNRVDGGSAVVGHHNNTFGASSLAMLGISGTWIGVSRGDNTLRLGYSLADVSSSHNTYCTCSHAFSIPKLIAFLKKEICGITEA